MIVKKTFSVVLTLLFMLILLTGCSEVDDYQSEYTEISGEVLNSASNSDTDYVYDHLTETEQECYTALVDGIMDFQTTITVPHELSPNQHRKIYIIAYSQNPEIFWLSNLYAPITASSDTYNVSYRFTKENASQAQQEINSAVAEIMKKIKPDYTPYQQMVVFHDEIVLNCQFEKGTEYGYSIYGALVKGTAQCEGYANAFSYLCNLQGIPNIIVRGQTIEGSAHAWNKVLLDGNWYNVDLTYDDPTFKTDKENYLSHEYFFISDEMILGITHTADESLFPHPQCKDNSLNYFSVNKLTADSADDATELVKKLVSEYAYKKQTEIEIQMTSEQGYLSAVENLIDNKGFKNIYDNLNSTQGAKISNAYSNKNDNLHTIHFSLIYD